MNGRLQIWLELWASLKSSGMTCNRTKKSFRYFTFFAKAQPFIQLVLDLQWLHQGKLTLSFIHIILTSIFRLQNHEIDCHYMLREGRTSKQAKEKAGEWVSNGGGRGMGEAIDNCISSQIISEILATIDWSGRGGLSQELCELMVWGDVIRLGQFLSHSIS